MTVVNLSSPFDEQFFFFFFERERSDRSDEGKSYSAIQGHMFPEIIHQSVQEIVTTCTLTLVSEVEMMAPVLTWHDAN